MPAASYVTPMALREGTTWEPSVLAGGQLQSRQGALLAHDPPLHADWIRDEIVSPEDAWLERQD